MRCGQPPQRAARKGAARQFARTLHQPLAVPANPNEWGDDDVLWVLSQRAVDTSGNLIVGEPACVLWQPAKAAAADPVKPRALGRTYEALAEQAVAAGVPGLCTLNAAFLSDGSTD